MKVVIDTNVLLSAFLTEGLSKKVFDICLDNADVYLSEWILNELKDKLERKFKVPAETINRLTGFLKYACIIVEPVGKLNTKCRDIKDDPVLLLADNVKADFIITGDKDLLDMPEHSSLRIINPRTFYDKYRFNT